jgi:hypothetical protein
MSFLTENNSEFLSARVTKKGRNSIAKGNFVISYFQIGDSEYDYTSPFTDLDGTFKKPFQRVFAPHDKETVAQKYAERKQKVKEFKEANKKK